jgi:hypothetical protein
MSIIVKDNGKDFERLEPGLHHAVCSHVVDLGLQDTPFGPKQKIAICFETEEKMQDGRLKRWSFRRGLIAAWRQRGRFLRTRAGQ